MNIQGWFPLASTGLISLLSKGLSRISSTVQKHQFFGAQPFLRSNSQIHTWLLEKTIALAIWTFVGKVMSLLLNILSRFVSTFLPRSKCLLFSWLRKSQSTVILEPKKIKSVTISTFFPPIWEQNYEAQIQDLFFLPVKTFKKALHTHPQIRTLISGLTLYCGKMEGKILLSLKVLIHHWVNILNPRQSRLPLLQLAPATILASRLNVLNALNANNVITQHRSG